MLRTFNMGMGFLLVVSAEDEEKTLRTLSQAGTDGIVIGRIVEGENRVRYTGNIHYATVE